MSAPLPVGVVGVGALGRHHARHLAAVPEARLVGVYDVDPARADAVAEEVGCVAFADLDRLLGQVEAVSVVVPTPAHLVVGLRALERGIPVLIEKPLAATLDEADRLVAAAAARGLQLQVGHIERFNRAVRAAAPYIEDPRFIEGHRLAPFQPRGTDVAVVLDLMIHDLDLILHLTGGAVPVDVRASGAAVLSPNLDIVNARVEFDNGAVAAVVSSRIARERVRHLRIFQPTGYLRLDLANGSAEFMRLRPGWVPGEGKQLEDAIERVVLEAPEADALRSELESFVHAVRGDQETVVTGAEGRAALALALQVTDAVARHPIGILGH